MGVRDRIARIPLPTFAREGRLMRFAARFDFKRLHRDEGGNVMVMYIAAALLLVGMLWAIIGTGARVVQKETLQSSADAAAFSAAVIKAKGMNIIAFCNLLMALLLAIIILLRLIKYALHLAAIIVAVALFPEGLPIAAELENIAQQFSQVAQKVEDAMMKAMKGIAKFERGVQSVTPALSLVEAYRVGTHASYQKNMGKGTLVTITLPLPLGQDLKLPAEDGTWEGLCKQARQMNKRILEWVIQKVVGSGLAKWLAKAFDIVLGPFESLVCGAGFGDVTAPDMEQPVEDCGRCASGDAIKTAWEGIPKGGGPVTQFQTGGFPGMADCSGAGFAWGGVEYQSTTFKYCVMKDKVSPGGTNSSFSDKPLPLELTKDWKDHSQIRSFTVLVGTKTDERRRSVGVGRKGGAGATGAPALDGLMTMAQAEFFSWNGHEDLWHMDWRARLVPFSMGGDMTGNQTGDTSGTVPGGAMQQVSGAWNKFMGSEEGQTLMRQFIIH